MVLGYILYVVFSYHRIDDNLILDVSKEATDNAPVNTELSLITYNIGFGAYSADYSFSIISPGAFRKNAVSSRTEVLKWKQEWERRNREL